jgi:hypothetical protein
MMRIGRKRCESFNLFTIFHCVHVMVIPKLFFDCLCLRCQRTNNVMGCYNRDFGGIFTTGSPQLVFCDVIQAETQNGYRDMREQKEELSLVDKTERM